MAENASNSPEQLQAEIESLKKNVYSLQLATLGTEGKPEISYTPFLHLAGNYYIFISQLASHTQNLMRKPELSVLLIEDEFTAKNIFARQRLSLECEAKEVDRTRDEWKVVLDAFEARHGNTVALLRSLTDFHLFELRPVSATFVKGFGQAFQLSGKNLDEIKHLKTQ